MPRPPWSSTGGARPLYEALSAEGTRGERLTPDALPATLVAATIAAEDRRFWSHPGVDPYRRRPRGADTISRSGESSKAGPRSRSRWRSCCSRGRAAGRARRGREDPRGGARASPGAPLFEARDPGAVSEPRVLRQPGQWAPRARAGCTSACRASMLTPAQAAFLAGLPQRPSRFNPWRDTRAAIARRRVVLRRMHAPAAMLDRTRSSWRRCTSGWRSTPRVRRFSAPHFAEMVLGGRRPRRGRAHRDDARPRSAARRRGHHRPAARVARPRTAPHNVAVVVLDNRDRASGSPGRAPATTSTRRTAARSTVRPSPRQPGSALKPFTYALAFEQGRGPATVLPDVPTHVPDRGARRPVQRRATTTAGTAVRCSRGGRSPDPRTCRRLRSRPTSACRSLLRVLRAAPA